MGLQQEPSSRPEPWPTCLDALDVICCLDHIWRVDWAVGSDPEFDALTTEVQDELLARAKLLKALGPVLGRPRLEALDGSGHTNIEELRFAAAGGVWRVAFAFDPQRKVILLVAGNKSGIGERRFYKQLVKKADERFDSHLGRLQDKRRTR